MERGIQYIPKEIITEEMMELAINADPDRIEDHDEMVKEYRRFREVETTGRLELEQILNQRMGESNKED